MAFVGAVVWPQSHRLSVRNPNLSEIQTYSRPQRLYEERYRSCIDVCLIAAEDMQHRAKNYPLPEVIAFLESKGLGCYSKIFEEFDINGELLIQFHDDELRDIGIDSALDRLRISTYFRRHVVKSEGLAELYPAVVQFLQEIRPLQQFAASFGENRIDGELLLNANDEVMNELGVEKGVHKLMIRQKFKARLD